MWTTHCRHGINTDHQHRITMLALAIGPDRISHVQVRVMTIEIRVTASRYSLFL